MCLALKQEQSSFRVSIPDLSVVVSQTIYNFQRLSLNVAMSGQLAQGTISNTE